MEVRRKSGDSSTASESQNTQNTRKTQAENATTVVSYNAVTADSVEPSNQNSNTMRDYLEAVGAFSVLSEAEIEEAAKDSNKLKGLLNVTASGQLVGASSDAIARAKGDFLKNPTKEGLANATFEMVADSQGVPADNARKAGLKNASDILGLKANLQLLGDDDADAKIRDPKFYDEIQKKGVSGVLADVAIASMGLPDTAKGLSLKTILNGTAAAQKKGKDQSDPAFWEKVKKEGLQSALGNHKKPHTADKGKGKSDAHPTAGNDGRGHGPNAKPGQHKAVVPIIHTDRSAHPGKAAGKAALNPLKTPHDAHADHAHHRPHQEETNQTHQSNTSQQHHQTSSSSRSQGGGSKPTYHASEHERPKGPQPPAGATGTPDGNATEGEGDPNAPTTGTNPTGGAANDYSSGDGAAQQTGVGISDVSGTEAGGGATYTVIDGGMNEDGSYSYVWTASGEGVHEGIYETTYTQDSSGNWTWVCNNAVTGEQVDSGTGVPPDPSIVGQSSQSTNEDTDEILFDAADDDSSGMPLPSDIGPANKGFKVFTQDWQMTAIWKGKNKNTDANPVAETRVSKGRLHSKGDEVTDARPELQSHNVFSTITTKRSDGFTDPSREGGSSRTPKSSTDGPSHAKDQTNRGTHHSHTTRRRNTRTP